MISNYIFKPGMKPLNEKDAARQSEAAKVKANVDEFEQKMLSFDNTDFDQNPEEDVVDLGSGVISDRMRYRGTYDKGEMNAWRSFNVFGNKFDLLDGVEVKKNNFGFDRTYKLHVGLEEGWQSYDDIRGGLVNYTAGAFRYIPV